MPQIDWSVINTGLIMAFITFAWRQSRMVDSLRQSILGVDGRGGLLDEMKMLRERTYDLTQKLSTLSMTVEELTVTIEERQRRRHE